MCGRSTYKLTWEKLVALYRLTLNQPPVNLLAQDDIEPWLTGTAGIELLKPAPNDLLLKWPVSKRVNSSRAGDDDPTLIEEVEMVSVQA